MTPCLTILPLCSPERYLRVNNLVDLLTFNDDRDHKQNNANWFRKVLDVGGRHARKC